MSGNERLEKNEPPRTAGHVEFRWKSSLSRQPGAGNSRQKPGKKRRETTQNRAKTGTDREKPPPRQHSRATTDRPAGTPEPGDGPGAAPLAAGPGGPHNHSLQLGFPPRAAPTPSGVARLLARGRTAPGASFVMADLVAITTQPRTGHGTRAARRLRR